ncbi:MAG: hypothetical protein ACK515_10350 [bacterium]|jgi:hypothetical protein
MTCSLGEIGGLLFLALFAGIVLLALAALILGAIGTRYMQDVNRVEAIQKQYRRDDL